MLQEELHDPIFISVLYLSCCLFFLGKDDELPTMKLGKIQLQPQPAMLNLTLLANGQSSTSESNADQAVQQAGQKTFPEKVQESSPNHRKSRDSLEKRPSLRHSRPLLENVQIGFSKYSTDNKKWTESESEGDLKQNHNVSANQNSNATSNIGIVPRWIKPSNIKIIEKTTNLTKEMRSRPSNHASSGTPPSPGGDEQPYNVKQKIQAWHADEGKRGSNASQYDNVPSADLEIDNSVDEMLERALLQSPRNTAHSSSSRKLTEKTSSPPKVSNSYASSSQPRIQRFSSQSDGTDLRHNIKPPPPSYSNPPVYHGNSPKHTTNIINSNYIPTQYHHRSRTNSPGQPYVSTFSTEKFTDKPLINYSISHQNLVVTPSSRIEVLPADTYIRSPKSPTGIRFAIPVVDYLPDHRKRSDPAYMYRHDAHGPSWSEDGSRSHFGNLMRNPPFQSTPVKDYNLPTVSVDSPIRYRTSPPSEERGSPRYQYPGPPGPTHHYRHKTDGFSLHESVLL